MESVDCNLQAARQFEDDLNQFRRLAIRTQLADFPQSSAACCLSCTISAFESFDSQGFGFLPKRLHGSDPEPSCRLFSICEFEGKRFKVNFNDFDRKSLFNCPTSANKWPAIGPTLTLRLRMNIFLFEPASSVGPTALHTTAKKTSNEIRIVHSHLLL